MTSCTLKQGLLEEKVKHNNALGFYRLADDSYAIYDGDAHRAFNALSIFELELHNATETSPACIAVPDALFIRVLPALIRAGFKVALLK